MPVGCHCPVEDGCPDGYSLGEGILIQKSSVSCKWGLNAIYSVLCFLVTKCRL
jgi:hypothetical protein